jgi:hypothetical protein
MEESDVTVRAESFETILPTVERYARKRLRDDDRVATAIVLAWHYWQTGPELPASAWARAAVRAVCAGRDLPGLHDGRRKDALDFAYQGAGMGEVMDREPQPLDAIVAKEEYERILASLNDRQRMLVDAIAGGNNRTDRLAEAFGISPARVSQMRREIMAKLDE